MQVERRIELLCDFSRWQGTDDFHVETDLMRLETEIELEGHCDMQYKCGEPGMASCLHRFVHQWTIRRIFVWVVYALLRVYACADLAYIRFVLSVGL